MRKLTVKQKKILDKWIEEVSPSPGLALCDVVEQYLPTKIWKELQRINDTEILYQEVNRYVNDKSMELDKSNNPHFRGL